MHRNITRRVQIPLAIITVHKDAVYSKAETKIALSCAYHELQK